MATQYSNSKQLLVYQVQPDDRAGWRYEAVDIENGTVLINDWVIAGGDFQQIMNGVGSGSIFLPKSDPVIEEAMKQGGNKKAVMVRAYLDGQFQYGFFLEFKTDEMTDDGGHLVRLHGKGMESIADDMKVRPKDHPNIPSTVETWIYGSTDNLFSNPTLDNTDLPDNADGSGGNDGEGHPLDWSKRGKLSAYEGVYSPGDGYEGRDWYIRFKPTEHHSGLTKTIPCIPGKFAHVRVYVREPDNLAQRYTLAVGGDTDIEAYGTVYTNQFEHNNEILAELDNVATGTGGCPGGESDGTWQVMDVEVKAGPEQTSLEISIQHDHHPTCGDFDNSYPELHIGLLEVESWGLNLDPWQTFQDDNHASNSFRREPAFAYPGTEFSLRLNALSQFAGYEEQNIGVQGNQRYRGQVKAFITTATAGDKVKFEILDPRTDAFLLQVEEDLVSGTWVTVEIDYTMPANIEEVTARFVYAGPNNPGPIYWSQWALVPGAPASTPGKILSDLITPIQTRLTHDYLNLDFTDEKDSAGRNWHSVVSMDINPGSSILGVLNRLVALGYEWRIAPSGYADGGGSSGFNLEVWNARDIDTSSGMGANLTGLNDPVVHTGDSITSGDTKVQTRRPNVVYVHGKDGYWTEVFQEDYAEYEAVVGRIEAHIDVGDVSDQNTLADFGEAFLLDERLREQGFRLTFARTAGIRPYRDFRVGDSIFVDAPPDYPDPDRATARRVRSIHITTGGEGSDITYEVDFDRVTYRDDAALLAVIAQLAERSPTDTSSQGSGSVNQTGSSSSVTISQGGTVSPHDHSMKDLTDKTLKGDVSGSVDGNIRVNKIKGIPVDVTIPAVVAGKTAYMEYDYANLAFSVGQETIPTVFDDLTDVDMTTDVPVDGQVPTWDQTGGNWVPADPQAPTTPVYPVINGYTEGEGNSSFVINRPATKLGEVMFLIVTLKVTSNGDYVATPSGFTKIAEVGNSTSDVNVASFYRKVDGTEPTNWTITNSVSEDMQGIMFRLGQVNQTTQIDAHGGASANLSGKPVTSPAITTTVDRCLVFSLIGFQGSDAGSFSITGNTEVRVGPWEASGISPSYDSGVVNDGVSMSWATNPLASFGDTGDVEWTNSNSNDGTTLYQIAFRPGDGQAEYLSDLDDVQDTVPDDGDGLVYEASTASWKPGAVSSSPTTTAGDLIKRGASVDERLAIGTNDQVLTVVSGAPAWAAATGGGGASTVTAGKVSGAEMRLTSTQSHVTDATWQSIDWDAEEYDDDGYWEGVTNPERITFAEAGRYEVMGAVIYATGTGVRYTRVIRNGNVANELVVIGPHDGSTARVPFSVIVNAAAGDYIEIQGYQNSGGALNFTGSGSVGDDAEVCRVQVNRLDVQSGYAGPQLSKVALTADFSITSASTYEAIDWDAADIDTNDGWEGVTNPDRLTAWADGTYEISANLRVSGTAATDEIRAGYRINGTSTDTDISLFRDDKGAANARNFSGKDTIELSANDYVQIMVWHEGATTRDVKDLSTATLKLERLSPDIAVAAKMRKNADQTITTSAYTELTFQTMEFENVSGVVSLADNAFVAPVDGYYEVGVIIPITSIQTDLRVRYTINDTSPANANHLIWDGHNIANRGPNGTAMMKLNAGDSVTLDYYADTAGSIRGGTASFETTAWFKRITNGAYGNTTPDWLDYDPSWRDSADTALDAGTGVAVESFRYQKIGSTVHLRMDIKIGTSPTLGAGTRWDFDLPFTMNAPMDGVAFGAGAVNEDGSGTYPVWGWLGTAASKEFYLIADDGTPPSSTAVDFDTPFTWATPDTLHFECTYETDE